MLWKILADAVMGLHLIVIGFFAVSAVLLALGLFRGHRKWQLLYCGVVAVALGIGVANRLGVLKSCSLTDLEFLLRRLYDPSESWLRTRSLLATIIFNTTGFEVPEFAFTILWGIIVAVMIGSLIFRRG